MPNLDAQLLLEFEMVQQGINRYNHQLNSMMEKGLESKTQHGRALIASVVDAVAEGVKELQTTTTSNRDIARKKLKEMDAEQVAYLSLLTLIDGISKRYSLMKVSRGIGLFIEDQDRLQRWITEDKETALAIIRMANDKTSTGRHQKHNGLVHKMNKDGFKHTEWTNEERIHVGIRMVDVIIRTTGIVALRKQLTARNKTTTYVEATPATLEWIRAFNDTNMGRKPRYVPCVIEPKDWDGVWGGGYYSQIINRLPLVRTN
jgi:DNA-directed RNA polymerase